MPDYRPGQRVTTSLEDNAKYYDPDLYSALLTFSNSLTLDPDELSENFLPLHGAKPNPKPFVVGVLPPNLPITGRILDRSASIAAQEQLGTAVPQTVPAGQAVPGNPGAAGAGGPNALSTDAQPGVGGANLPPSFWNKYVEMCNRLGIHPLELVIVINNESGFKPGSQNFTTKKGRAKEAVAKGLNQLTKATAKSKGMTEEEWSTYQNMSAEDQLYWVEKFYQGHGGKDTLDLYRVTFGGYAGHKDEKLNNPDGSLYASKEWQAKYTADHPGTVWPFPGSNDSSYYSNINLDIAEGSFAALVGHIDPKNPPRKGWIGESDLRRIIGNGYPSDLNDRIEAAQKAVGNSKGTPPQRPGAAGGGGAGGTTNAWASGGSSAAQAAHRRISKLATGDVNLTTGLGQDLRTLQEAYIREVSAQAAAMRDAPPLRLLVNPSSFKVASEKVISDGTGGRYGPIVEHWGDGQDKIDFSGKIAAFYTVDPAGETRGSGLSRASRNFSASFKNFMSLYLLYRNNGALYTLADPTQPPTFTAVGTVYLYYDGILYLGSFDTFSITESEDIPYSLEYSLTFTVRMEFQLDLQIDETFAYGAPRNLSKQPIQTTSDPFNPALATVYNSTVRSNVKRFEASRDWIAKHPDEWAKYMSGTPQSTTTPSPLPGTGTTTQPATAPETKEQTNARIFLLISNTNTGKK